MPKDDTDTLGETSKGALKRGDACLYCRKRRIRCSATKPTCDHCKKLSKDCVYDAGKPVSRVKQLEEKVAELQAKLRQEATTGQGSQNGSLNTNRGERDNEQSPSSSGYQPDFFATYGNLAGAGTQYTMPPQEGLMDFSKMPNDQPISTDFFGFGSNIFAPPSNTTFTPTGQSRLNPLTNSSVFPQFNSLDVPIEQTFDFSMLDPNFMNLINSFGDTSTGPDTFVFPNTQEPSHQAPSASMQVDPTEFMGQLDDTALFNQFINPSPAPNPFPPDTFGNNGPSQTTSNSSPEGSGTSDSSHQPTSNLFTSSNQSSSSSSIPQNAYDQAPISSAYTPATLSEKARETFSGSIEPTTNAIGMTLMFDEPAQPKKAHKLTRTFGLALSSQIEEKGFPSDPVFDSLPMVGGWFDAADLPTVARDHLLDIFFSGMKVVGQEFHIPRFLASLSLPPAKRPHPCLLYTMYLLASRASSHPPIRSLESHFYSIATKQLEEAVAMADRLFDAVRAATMLAVYKYGLAKYHEGYMMTGMAARLALSAGLHQIPSSVFKSSASAYDRRADLGALMRQRTYVISPPADAIDLGERIWAFWAIYTVDRAGAISSQWPCAIPDSIICTPYPKPLHEYELGIVSTKDDVTISSTWTPSSISPLVPSLNPNAKSSMMILYLRALSILERASKLMYLVPEPGWDSDLDSLRTHTPNNNGISPGQGIDDFLLYQNAMAKDQENYRGGETGKSKEGWTKTAKIRTPKAYEEVRQALLRMEVDLPPERQTNWQTWNGEMGAWHFMPGRKKEAVTLHFVIGCSWMFLFDVFAFNEENLLSVNVARRLTYTIQHVIQEEEYAEMDVFIAMVWSFMIKILIREVKRLHAIGQMQAASPIEVEVEVIVQALKKVGMRYQVASLQALRADRYRKSTMAETDYLNQTDCY